MKRIAANKTDNRIGPLQIESETINTGRKKIMAKIIAFFT
jgi:hypothetical protein